MKFNIQSSLVRDKFKDPEKPCQDFVAALERHDGVIIGAVADGMGGSHRSEIGAELAVQTALGYLADVKFDGPPDSDALREVFTKTFLNCREAIYTHVRHSGLLRHDFETTLQSFVIAKNWFAIGSIGDGFAVAKSNRDDDFCLLLPPQQGRFVGETYSIVSCDIEMMLQTRLVEEDLNSLVVSTDGLLDLYTSGKPSFEPFQPFFDFVSSKNHSDGSLEAILKSEQVIENTSDDLGVVAITVCNQSNLEV